MRKNQVLLIIDRSSEVMANTMHLCRSLDRRSDVYICTYIHLSVIVDPWFASQEVQIVGAFSWLLGAPPRDTPICGFHGSKCDGRQSPAQGREWP